MTSNGYIEEIQYIGPPDDIKRYPYNLAFLTSLNNLKLNEKVTFIIGENGSGKSTLIEAIAIAYGFNAEGGSKNFNFGLKDCSSDLYKRIILKKTAHRAKDGFFLRAESFYNVAAEIERLDAIPAAAPKIIDAYGGRSLHEQSHGESFLALMNNRFTGNGIYILDEPESALSAQRQLSFLSQLHTLVKKNSQFIIATHSPIILSYPYSTIYSLDHDKIEIKDYTETPPYQFTKMFINDYKQVLHYLFLK